MRLATTRHIETLQVPDGSLDAESVAGYEYGYGYGFWMSRDGYRGDGAFGQLCLVFPEHDLVVVVVVTAGDGPSGVTPAAVGDCLLLGLDDPGQ